MNNTKNLVVFEIPVGSRCCICKGESKTAHHVVPREKGGSDDYNNIVLMCFKCHDIAEGICGKCGSQLLCGRQKFLECWGFDDALPPIHYRLKEEGLFINTDESVSRCALCGHKDIVRVSLWDTSIYKQPVLYYASFYCNHCKGFYQRGVVKDDMYHIIDKVLVKLRVGSVLTSDYPVMVICNKKAEKDSALSDEGMTYEMKEYE